MSRIHRTKGNRVLSRLKIAGATWLLALSALTGGSVASCSSGATCGAGTALDEASNICIPTGDLNVIVGDFKVGKYKFTKVDVPERLSTGTPDTRNFTITNEGTEPRPIVAVRVGIVPVKETIDELRDALETVDDEGLPGTTMIASTTVENLAAGESREVSIDYVVPPGVVDGLYGSFFAVDEVPLTRDADGNVITDPAAPEQEIGTSPLDDAALVYAPATIIVGVPDKPNLRILDASVTNSSFELDATEQNAKSIVTLNGRMSAQGRDVTEPIVATFELALPGHVVDVAGQDLGREAFDSDEAFGAAPATTTYKTDANRKFQLLARQGSNYVDSVTYEKTCRTDAEGKDTSECATIFSETALEANLDLHLSARDTRLLEQTRKLATLNPGLDDKGELKGTLKLKVATTQAEYQGNLADNERSIPIVFMAPEVAAAAGDADEDNDGLTEVPDALRMKGPYPYKLGGYSTDGRSGNKDYYVEQKSSSTGTFAKTGATAAQFAYAAEASQEHVFQVTAPKNLKIESGYRWVTEKIEQLNPTLRLTSNYDWGYPRNTNTYTAGVTMYGVAGYVIMDQVYRPSNCTKGVGLAGNDLTLDPLAKRCRVVLPGEKGRTTIAFSTLKAGFGGAGSANPWFITDLFFTVTFGADMGFMFVEEQFGAVRRERVNMNMRPNLDISGGGAPQSKDIGYTRYTLTGSYGRSVRQSWEREQTRVHNIDEAAKCWKAARMSTKQSFERESLVDAWGDEILSLWYDERKCDPTVWIAGRGYVTGQCRSSGSGISSLPLRNWGTKKGPVSFDPEESGKRWRLRPGEPGACPVMTDVNTEVVWNSPTNCGGGYCSDSTRNAPGPISAGLIAAGWFPANVMPAYRKEYNPPDACATVTINGRVRQGVDWVTLYKRNGEGDLQPFFRRLSGPINWTGTVCGATVGVALETRAGVPAGKFPGISVTFKPLDEASTDGPGTPD